MQHKLFLVYLGRVGRWTWEDCEASVIGMYCRKFPNNLYEYYVGKTNKSHFHIHFVYVELSRARGAFSFSLICNSLMASVVDTFHIFCLHIFL